MTTSPLTRAEQKERTRRAVLDAALGLCEDAPLAALSLRQVAKEVGIVPTAFYRHFASIEDLGLALVEESLATLRGVLRDVRRGPGPSYAAIIDASVAVLVDHVRRQRRHFTFIARERMAGPPAVRDAIATGIGLFERELATDLAHLPGTDTWAAEDLRILSDLIVSAMVTTAEKLVGTEAGSPAESAVAATARAQLRMTLVGAANWHPA
ncbi:TetR family transcriptional regulator [Nocardioides sambongensis]|uniref:TetR family transcriptional regulator n=1 Tax=Nocardioides sambongensis TaxID=2589074 RepID=UPI00112AF00E|nr:TetR family transcriptional regulator [Nocardioides sambongensis]